MVETWVDVRDSPHIRQGHYKMPVGQGCYWIQPLVHGPVFGICQEYTRYIPAYTWYIPGMTVHSLFQPPILLAVALVALLFGTYSESGMWIWGIQIYHEYPMDKHDITT